MTKAVELAQVASTGVSEAFKNRIINGGMVIDQRNAGASVTPANGAVTYTLDRWGFFVNQASKLTVQQNSGSVTPPVGFTNYLGVVSSSAYSVGSTDRFLMYQAIEGFNIADLGWGTANAKTITLSFWARSSLTGTFSGSLQNNGSSRCYVFSYSIPVANTWTQISITIPGDTTGTWLTTNGAGIQLVFSYGTGSTYLNTAGSWYGSLFDGATGQTNLVGTNGATFYITGVQLEVGSSATNFEYLDYGNILRQCQRYYEKTYNMSAVPGTNVGPNTGEWLSVTINSVDFYDFGKGTFRVSKRASPTFTPYSTDGTINTGRQQDASNVPIIARFASENNFGLFGSGMVTNNYLRVHWTASAEL